MDVKASHPHHTNLRGRQGGSLPKVNNNFVKACGESLEKARADRQSKLGHLKNPVSRLGK